MANVGPVQGIKPPNPFVIGSNPTENWKLFKQRYKTYALLAQLDKQSQEYQTAMFTHCLSDEALKVYNSFHFEDENPTVTQIMEKFDEFAVGEVNVTYERFMFNQRKQEEGETFEQFYSAARNLSKTCDFCENCRDSMIRDKIVLGIRNCNTQTELLKTRDLNLTKCIDTCRAAENAMLQGKAMNFQDSPEEVHKLKTESRPDTMLKECKFCGTRHRLKKEECPAYGKTCFRCSGRNHFGRKCTTGNKDMKREVNQVEPVQENSPKDKEDWINSIDQHSKDVKCTMIVQGQEVTFQIDTGSSVNMIPAKYARDVEPTDKIMKMWNNAKMKPVGKTTQNITNPKNKKVYKVDFIVFEDNFTPLLGLQISEEMGLINIQKENFVQVAQLHPLPTTDEYQDVFDGTLGKLPGLQHLEVDPLAKPVIMPDRRTPIAIRPQLKNELDKMVKGGVIAPVTEPTPWVSQIVVTKKKQGGLRMCIDPPELNKALKRERYTMPVLEDVIHDLSKSKIFTKADLSSGFWHVQLDEESSRLTTFQTCYGRYRWLRLPFGTSVSSEIFQRKLAEALSGLPGVVSVADDVIIHGDTMESHDAHNKAFLQQCRDQSIKLNEAKLELRSDNVTFMGHQITKDGLQTDPEKVKAIKDYPAPTKVEELRRFLGMVNYLARYLYHLTDDLQPLQNLLKKDVQWTWASSQEKAFQTVKEKITNSPTLAFYKQDDSLTLINDASEYGLGSVLMQKNRPVAYASRTLTPTKRNYAQIEKEMLAVLFGLQKFHHYTYGRPIHIVTDHKPLVAISHKPLSKAPMRLQSMLLRAQMYDFSLEYKPGTQIPVADALSRAPVSTGVDAESEVINSLTLSPFTPQRLEEIKLKTAEDFTLIELKEVILRGWPSARQDCPLPVTPYFDYRDELTVQDGIILRGDRVIIPHKMRQEMKEKVHAGHSGINSCLRRARELVFWPRMSAEIRHFIESCDVCTSYSAKQPAETLRMHEVPDRPWEKVGTDIFTIQGRNYLITVDYFSHFFELDYLPETTAETVVTKLKHHFARHGIPDTVVSDNGPQFSSQQFRLFSRSWSFRHVTSSPGHSQSNGAAEAAVKVAKNMMKKCLHAKEDPYLGLLNLRNTPEEGMTSSPTQRLMGRRTKTSLPTTFKLLQPTAGDYIKQEKTPSRKQTSNNSGTLLSPKGPQTPGWW